jgi:predicted nuclease with TOPRIM domain
MKTYKDLTNLIADLNAVIGTQETKTQKKLFKLYERVKSHHEAYQSEIEELRLDNAATDDKGILLSDDKGGYQFTKDGLKKLRLDIESLNAKEIDFKVIEVVNPQGLETFNFLEGWTNGIKFEIEEEDDL